MARRKKILPNKKNFSGLLRGEFLIKTGSEQNWKFMLYLVFLAFLSISSSHLVDRKVVRILALQDEIEDLKSQYTDKHRDLMKMQLETHILQRTAIYGLSIPNKQPFYIVDKVYDTINKK